MPSGVIRLRAARINHPMPMLDNPYSGDHSGLRGQKTRDSATLKNYQPSAPAKPGTFKKYDDVRYTMPKAIDKGIDGEGAVSRSGKKHGGSKGR